LRDGVVLRHELKRDRIAHFRGDIGRIVRKGIVLTDFHVDDFAHNETDRQESSEDSGEMHLGSLKTWRK